MRTSLNYTSFVSQKVRTEILAAMALALETGESTRLINRKGEAWLLVTILKDTLGYRFAFIDVAGDDRAKDIQKAAVSKWLDDEWSCYWSLMAKSFDLTVHPLVTASVKAIRAAEEAQKLADLMSLGVTHKVHSWGGTVLYGAYQRNWYGAKRLYVWRPGREVGNCGTVIGGEWVKVSPELKATIRFVEAL